jgi:endonuclease/exonuclease/phosphatase family metal-dependent hydrolase
MARSLRLVTWNLWGRAGDWAGRQQAIDAALAAVRPDIVAIQETWRDGDRWPQAERLAEILGCQVVAAAPAPRAPGDYGLAILSRWPISDHRIHPLPVADAPPDERIGLEARIVTPAGILSVTTVHLSWPLEQSQVRQDQVRAAVSALVSGESSERLPQVLCGDFNADPASDEIRMLTGLTRVPVPGVVFQDAWQAGGDGGPGHTWSHRNPAAAQGRFGNVRLDYVFVRWAGRGAIIRAEVVDGRGPDGTWGSDHLAVLAELDLDALADRPCAPAH